MEATGVRRNLLGGSLGFRHRKVSDSMEKDAPGTMQASEKQISPKRENKLPPRQVDSQQQQNVSKREPHSMLEEFFEALESTVALLRIRSQPCTFSAVSSAVESLTKRRFLHSHLAKIKHLFPEAIECDSFTWKDLDSSTLKTDIRIKILPFSSAEVKGTKSVTGISRKWSADTVARRREFHKRILAFEGDEVPEAPLLQEGAEAKVTGLPDVLTGNLGTPTKKQELQKTIERDEDEDTDTKVNIPDVLTGKVAIKTGYQDILSRRSRSDDEINTSHFPSSFRRHFSKQRVLHSQDQTDIPATEVHTEPEVHTKAEGTEPETPRPYKASDSTSEARTGPGSRTRPYSLVDSVDILPKVKPDGTPPKRQSVVKSLQFDDSHSNSAKKLLGVLPDELLQSICEKEKKAIEDVKSMPAKRRLQMLAGLTQFLNATRLTFQSQAKFVMLHKELVEHMKSSSVEITDTGEIEERLRLLLEFAPEWISLRTSLTGETIYRVQKTADFALIRKRITDAA